jgi:sRNA-binding carbon storage regulator CsrA
MLILTRKIGQAVTIGDDIVLRVAEKSHGAVTFDVTAPEGTIAEYADRDGNPRRTAVGKRMTTRRGDHTIRLIHPDGTACVIRPFPEGCHGQVRLGFVAPRVVAVHREEIAERIRRGIPWPGAARLALVCLLATMVTGCHIKLSDRLQALDIYATGRAAA